MPIYCSCIECKSQVATSQLSKHYKSFLCRSGGKYIPLKNCPYCLLAKDNIIDDFANHVKFCELNPNKELYKNRKGSVYEKGRVAWNKDKTKETDSRLKKSSESLSKTLKNYPRKGCCAPTYFGTEAHRRSSSKGGGYRENAGRSKKFKVMDSFGNLTTLQSTYELCVFEILCELEIRWIRPKALKYDSRNYFADFYLIDFDVYLDPKNEYKAKCDAAKISKVKEQNDVILIVLLKENINKRYIASLVN